MLASLAAALLIAAPWSSPAGHAVQPSSVSAVQSTGSAPSPAPGPPGKALETPQAGPVVPGVSAPAAAAPGRVQQLGASVTLAPASGEVQAISDGVSRLAVRAGGYVASSHVQVQSAGTSEAVLSLRVPSAGLAAALASIERLAPVRAETQGVQDITSSYDAAERSLAVLRAERSGLLRALAAASSEGQVDSLRERLRQSSSAIAGAEANLRAVQRQASTAEVEVTVLGEQPAPESAFTVRKAVHDAGHVLLVSLTVLLIALAVLLPLSIALGLLGAGHAAWRRHSRERALG
jgi:hypothetical protein